MPDLNLIVRRAHRSDATWMDAAFDGQLLQRAAYFEDLCLQQEAGLLALLVAEQGSQDYAGHLRIHWQASYAPFREERVPEIQDLSVLPRLRRQGVASRLLDAAEDLIRQEAAAGA